MIDPAECRARRCRHLVDTSIVPGTEYNDPVALKWHCSAFPDGIPAEIAHGTDKHLTKHKKQKNNLVYEKAVTVEDIERVQGIGRHDPRER